MNIPLKSKVLIALGAFVFIAALIKLDEFLLFLNKLITLCFPVIFGFILAVLLDSPVKKAEELLGKKIKQNDRLRRILAVFSIYFIIVGIIAAVFVYLIPSLLESVKLFAGSFDNLYGRFMKKLESTKEQTNFSIAEMIGNGVDLLIEYVKKLLPMIAEKTVDFFTGAANFIISAVISAYFLIDKEKALCAVGKILTAFLGEEKMCTAVKYAGLITGCFSRFIRGQLTEAAVLGILCFLGNIIFGFDYPLLIAAIIGITALIPVVGAFIGTIPAALMLFRVEPVKAVWFVVFIIVLQQIEGNIIYPKIVGKSVGLPPVIILIAIFIGAGLGGSAGILLSVPAASAIYLIITEKAENSL